MLHGTSLLLVRHEFRLFLYYLRRSMSTSHAGIKRSSRAASPSDTEYRTVYGETRRRPERAEAEGWRVRILRLDAEDGSRISNRGMLTGLKRL